ncbi:MAG: hypothetical protein ACREOB_07785 [Thermodesulfobacteriota bacterium]
MKYELIDNVRTLQFQEVRRTAHTWRDSGTYEMVTFYTRDDRPAFVVWAPGQEALAIVSE